MSGVPVMYVRFAAARASPIGTAVPTAPARSSCGEVTVQPLAVLEEVGVAVLVAGAGDEHRPLLGEGLGPVERQRDSGEGLVIDEVVARHGSRRR